MAYGDPERDADFEVGDAAVRIGSDEGGPAEEATRSAWPSPAAGALRAGARNFDGVYGQFKVTVHIGAPPD